MKLRILGSSSRGNSYILENDREALLLEAGIRAEEVKRALGFNISKVKGMLVSHSHGDHGKYAHEYAKAGVTVMAPGDVFRIPHNRNRPIQIGYGYVVGNFKVLPFNVEHDVPCYGYQIDHDDMGRLIFLTDSYMSTYTFKNVRHWMVEDNFSDPILDANIEAGKLHPSLRQRIRTSHMAHETLIDLLKSNDLSQTHNIILLHLSDGNSDEKQFVEDITALTGKQVFAANKGMEVDLSLPF
jgi:phosphoribosyl 1,2-cyclic phosphodiesterase